MMRPTAISVVRILRSLAANPTARPFRTSAITPSQRAVVYNHTGPPTSVLSVRSFPSLPPPPPNTANVCFLLSPINPADINVIEGVYPARPSPCTDLSGSESPLFVGGNEGVARVVSVGDGVTELREGDWVVMSRPQVGTWASSRNVRVEDMLRVDASGLTAAQAATLTVNPPTAYNMLHDFVQLKEGDWVVQNGANSAAGQAVIQIAAAKGFKTVNFIRNRDDVESLKSHLKGLGATHVATYDELADKAFKATFSSWTQGKGVKLGLNCVGGKMTTLMARLLGENSHLVTYGAMSKEPLSLPTSLFIFKNLTCHGFWQSRWYDQKTLSERTRMMHTLTDLIRQGKLDSPEHAILEIGRHESDSDATEKIRTMFSRLAGGKYGKKVLLKVDMGPGNQFLSTS